MPHRVLLIVLFIETCTFAQIWVPFAGKEYHVSAGLVDFTEARTLCSTMNAQLVVIYNQTIQHFLETTIFTEFRSTGASNAFWIGLHRNRIINAIQWVDGSAYTDESYDNFYFGENLNGREGCVTMGYPSIQLSSVNRLQWFSVPCKGHRSAFICQRNKERIQPTNKIQELQNRHSSSTGSTINITLLAAVLGSVILVCVAVASIVYLIKLKRSKETISRNAESSSHYKPDDSNTYETIEPTDYVRPKNYQYAVNPQCTQGVLELDERLDDKNAYEEMYIYPNLLKEESGYEEVEVRFSRLTRFNNVGNQT